MTELHYGHIITLLYCIYVSKHAWCIHVFMQAVIHEYICMYVCINLYAYMHVCVYGSYMYVCMSR